MGGSEGGSGRKSVTKKTKFKMKKKQTLKEGVNTIIPLRFMATNFILKLE